MQSHTIGSLFEFVWRGFLYLKLRKTLNGGCVSKKQKITPIPAIWREWEYRLDICRVTHGAHNEYI
jgi:hypothetical protein